MFNYPASQIFFIIQRKSFPFIYNIPITPKIGPINSIFELKMLLKSSLFELLSNSFYYK
jgi:hypothetical protein